MVIEQPLRIIQTTLIHPLLTEAAVSVVFVKLDEAPAMDEVLAQLNIQKRPGEVPADADKLAGVVASWIDKAAFEAAGIRANPLVGGIDVGVYVSWLLRDTECIVVEQSPTQLLSLTEFLKKGTGVSIGAYVGLQVASGPLLFVTVPLGIMIVGVAVGVSDALRIGLYDRLIAFVSGHSKRNAKAGNTGNTSTGTRNLAREH